MFPYLSNSLVCFLPLRRSLTPSDKMKIRTSLVSHLQHNSFGRVRYQEPLLGGLSSMSIHVCLGLGTPLTSLSYTSTPLAYIYRVWEKEGWMVKERLRRVTGVLSWSPFLQTHSFSCPQSKDSVSSNVFPVLTRLFLLSRTPVFSCVYCGWSGWWWADVCSQL